MPKLGIKKNMYQGCRVVKRLSMRLMMFLKNFKDNKKEAQAAVNTDYINARIEEAKNFSDDELKKLYLNGNLLFQE